jgi:DNA-binding LacI/PurR family transcriptional regulator
MNSTQQATTIHLPKRQKRERLFEDLRESIESDRLKPGDRIAPLRELAEQYDLSYSTARSVVQQLESAGLAKRQPNTYSIVLGKPAAAEQSHDNTPNSRDTLSRSISILYEIRDDIVAPIVHHLTEMMLAHGLCATVIGRQIDRGIEQFDDLLTYWQNRPPQIVVNCLGKLGLHDAITKACPADTRLIAVGNHQNLRTANWHHVGVNHDQLGKLAVDHLLLQGHKRICLLTHRRKMNVDVDPIYKRKRNTGHTPFILALGQALRERDMKHALTILYHDSLDTPAKMEEITNQIKSCLTQPDRPTAFIGHDYAMAYIARAAGEIGLTPSRDFELVGLGNTNWSNLLGFSSIDYCPQQIAKRVIQLIEMPKTQCDDASMSIMVQPRMITRNTMPKPLQKLD